MINSGIDFQTDTWDFDGFQVDKNIGGNLLSRLAMHFLEEVIDVLQIDREKLERFLIKIEQGYKVSNAYHNSIHAASVLQCVHRILLHAKVIEKISSESRSRSILILTACIASVVHDYRHAGVSNKFLIDAASPTAIVYNDASPQENMHSASAFKLLMDDRYNFLKSFSKEEARTFRNHVISMVLHTDLQHHFPLLSRFKNRMSIPDSRRSSFEFSSHHPQENHDENFTIEDTTLILQMVLKVADLSHLTYSFDLHRKWVSKLEEEMFNQGDIEAHMGLTRSAMCDREKPGISTSQADFFDFVATGLIRVFSNVFPGTLPMFEALQRNHHEWEIIELGHF
jgi:hypothetical protein